MLANVQDVYGENTPGRSSHGASSSTDAEVMPRDLLLMGIMASDVKLAMRGFRDYCQALGLEFVVPENRVSPGKTRMSENLVSICPHTLVRFLQGRRRWPKSRVAFISSITQYPRCGTAIAFKTLMSDVRRHTMAQVCYVSPYLGNERGVLLQLGQERLQGHFPLGLWDEEQRNPPPVF